MMVKSTMHRPRQNSTAEITALAETSRRLPQRPPRETLNERPSVIYAPMSDVTARIGFSMPRKFARMMTPASTYCCTFCCACMTPLSAVQKQ